MSRANAQVKFPDGTIKYGIYNGTVDVYWAPLFNSSEEAWDAWTEYYKKETLDERRWLDPHDDSYYDVEIADSYGNGSTYNGRASKSQIVGATNIDFMNQKLSGLPEWWSSGEPPTSKKASQEIESESKK